MKVRRNPGRWLLILLMKKTWDLSVKNPNVDDEVVLRAPSEIIEEIIALDKESEAILASSHPKTEHRKQTCL